MPSPPYPMMNDDDYQAEQDLYTLARAQEITPEREAKARTMAQQKAKELEAMAAAPGPRTQNDLVTKGYKVLKES